MGDPAAVFKAYDVRGLVPEELDVDLARSIGGAYARLVRAEEPETTTVAVAPRRMTIWETRPRWLNGEPRL